VREYSTREVQGVTGLPIGQIRRWARAGLVAPRKDRRGRWRFSFQDLALLRTARELLDAGLSTNRVTRALGTLRDQLPGRPLSAVRILVVGKRVVVKDRLASWEPESRQGMLDFDVRTLSAEIAPKIPLDARSEAKTEARIKPSAAELYQSAIDLELSGRGDEARSAYESALEQNPRLVSARINLGRLLHDAGRFAEAESMYRAALDDDPGSALAAFNLGVALEDRGRPEAAVDAYSRAIAIDDTHADAHFNLSRLLEAKGDRRAALRHLSRFRRLMREDG
jgi:tetratricopeptide (TPR) repeat protein